MTAWFIKTDITTERENVQKLLTLTVMPDSESTNTGNASQTALLVLKISESVLDVDSENLKITIVALDTCTLEDLSGKTG